MIGTKNMPDIAADTLAERVLQGDRSAEEELVKRYWRGIFLIIRIRVRGRDPEEAYDLTQQTFMVVLQAIRAGKLREHEKLTGFIHGVARNLTNNFLYHEVAPCALEEEVPGPDAVEILEAADRRRKAHAAINCLNDLDQQILLGVLVDGLSPEELGEKLNRSPATIRQRKSRALKKLRKKFGRVSHFQEF